MMIFAKIANLNPIWLDSDDYREKMKVRGPWEFDLVVVRCDLPFETIAQHLKDGTTFQLVPIDE